MGTALSVTARIVLYSAATFPILALCAAAGRVPLGLAAIGGTIVTLTTVAAAALGVLLGSAVRTRARATIAGLAAGCAILTSAPLAATLSLGITGAMIDGVPAGIARQSMALWVAAGALLSWTHPLAAASATAAAWRRQGTLGTFALTLGQEARVLTLPMPWAPYAIVAVVAIAALVAAAGQVLEARRAG
jgi:hypothetical protein